MSGKRLHSEVVDDEEDGSFSECDSCDSDDSESEDDDDETSECDDPQQLDREWKSVPPSFIPRKTIPSYKKPEIFECDEKSTITEIFLKLFPKSLLIWIAECTNERLEILSEKKGKPIKPTNPDEIMVVLGVLLVMSYNRVPHMWMYWSQNKSLRNETIAAAISRNRFMLLHSKIYFNHPSKPKDAPKTYYTTELVSCLIHTFNKYRSEATHQSIDEFMVKFKGRTSMKQYMPIKPVKKGMKGYARADADTGYMYYFYIYEGQEKQPSEGTLGERVVNSLCAPIREENVVIVIDRFFTSVELLRTLDYACLGTVMSNRKNLPDVKGKLIRGQSVAKSTGDGVIFYKWQDTKEVSWIRKRDLHILTAGTAVYTSDQRFQVQRPQNSTLWTLQIKYPQLRDIGVYECQINSEPKMSLSYTLNVIELKAVVLGTADLYVKTGSDKNLTCKISKGPHELGTVFWYKGNEIIDLITQENDIYSENMQRITVDSDWADGLISRLKIRQAVPNDKGNYTCVSTIARPASVYVHVISGEHPAAMQHNSADKHFTKQPMLVLPVATFAAGGAAIATKLLATVIVIATAICSILFEIWIVLARFRKKLFNSILWPLALVWIGR